MPTFVFGEQTFTTDDDGFIQEPERWDRALAEALARADGITALTEEHWRVLDYLRGYWIEYDSAPMVRRLVKATGVPLQRIYALFPAGPAQGACKIAGLPKPTGCV
ncbi:MAG: TusE/DsrC/DsvC family sulfur relay protein [Pseudomonadota bacterium]